MSICSPALATKKIPTCVQEIIIGSITPHNATVAVVIKDVTTERIEIIQASSDGFGIITVDVSDKKFAANHSYELWIFLASENFEDKQDITIGTQTADLVQLDFVDIYEGADEQFLVTSITLEEA